MNPSEAPASTQFKVGVFTVVGLLLIGAVTVFVNDKPYWWRPCQLVRINVEDATGLKTKSPVRSLGLEIGYLRSVDLSETHVTLGICVTAPVEVLPTTRAYIRGEGFLGDKFVELKPVKYTGGRSEEAGPASEAPEAPATPAAKSSRRGILPRVLDAIITPANADEDVTESVKKYKREPAADAADKKGGKPAREVPVGENPQDINQLVNRVDSLVNEMSGLTSNLKTALNPDELKATMRQLNHTLENASRTLSPEGGLNQTAQRTLAKLEDAIEQLRDMMTRINKGEGSVGMLINDPSYAEQIKEAINNINKLLSKVGGIRFVMDIGAQRLQAYDGSRGWFKLQIYPKPDRYYLLGVSVDSKGRVQEIDTTTTVPGGTPVTVHTTTVETTGLLLTAMVGKIFYNRLDLAIGALYGDGAASIGLNLGPHNREDILQIKTDIYSRQGANLDDRATITLHPLPWWFPTVYVNAGVEGFREINGRANFFYGAGLVFDDEDIKILFALR